MPRVTFGSAIQRHIAVPPVEVGGTVVREALEQVFQQHPRVKSYVLDDQSSLRKHMHIFVDGVAIADRRALNDAVQPSSHIYVVQALSGG
jgi:sulfur-carrier protein